jgi:hypothetical protein
MKAFKSCSMELEALFGMLTVSLDEAIEKSYRRRRWT